MSQSENFNVEEFVNFGSSESQDMSISAPLQESNTWAEYPDLFNAQEASSPPEDPISIINFDGATLINEEYVDPFAALLANPTSEPRFTADFLSKLQSRRKKLDEMAKNLTKSNGEVSSLERWDLLESSLTSSIECKPVTTTWKSERSVQVYHCQILPIFAGMETLEIREMASKMLDLFSIHLPEFLTTC